MTATHPMQLSGAPRRWHLTTNLVLPAVGNVLAMVALWCWVVALEFFTPQSRAPLAMEMSAEAIRSSERWMLAAVIVVALALACLVAGRALRRRAWWFVNPHRADRGAEPGWIDATFRAVDLAATAALLGYIVLHPSLAGAVAVCGVVIAPAVRPLVDLAARLLARTFNVPLDQRGGQSQGATVWALALSAVAVAVAVAVAWLRGDPLWDYLPVEWVTVLILPLSGLLVVVWAALRVVIAWPGPGTAHAGGVVPSA